MRVAMIDPSLFTLPYDTALCRALEHAGCDVTLYGRKRRITDGDMTCKYLMPHFYSLSERPAWRGWPAPLASMVRALDHAASVLRLLRLLEITRPEIIHFQWLPLPLLDGALLPQFRRLAPLVLTVHDTDPFNGNPAARAQLLGMNRAMLRFDRLIVHTQQAVARLHAQGVPVQRMTVLAHGPATGVAGDTQDAMHGTLTFLLFGKIKPYKGADLLIDAYADLPQSLRQHACVRIVGKPYMDVAPLVARAAARGVSDGVSIEPDFVPDNAINGLFGSATVAVFPYREIEASGVLYQAVANGRPIVASKLGAFAELLQDGIHGHLVPPGDAQSLSAALASLIEDRGKTAAYAHAVRRLQDALPGWNDIGRATLAVYEAARTHKPVHGLQIGATASAEA